MSAEQQLIVQFFGKFDKSITNAVKSLADVSANLRVGLNRVYNESTRLENQLNKLALVIKKMGTSASQESGNVQRLAAQTEAYAQALKHIDSDSAARGIQKGSTAYSEQVKALNKLEAQLYKTSRTLGTAGDAWYQGQNRIKLLNTAFTQGSSAVDRYLSAVTKVGTYGPRYMGALQTASAKYGMGSAQFMEVAKAIEHVGAAEDTLAMKAKLAGEAFQRTQGKNQILAQAEQERAGLVSYSTKTKSYTTVDPSDTKNISDAKKAVYEYADGLKNLGKYGREYQEAAVSLSKSYGRDSAQYSALYKNLTAVGEAELSAVSRASATGEAYTKLGTSVNVANEAIARHGKTQTEWSQKIKESVSLIPQQTAVLKTFNDILNNVGRALKTLTSFAMAGGIITGFALATKSVFDYDQALRDMQAVTQASEAQTAELGATLRNTAKDINTPIDQVAKGMTQLSQAGLSADEVMQTVGGVTKLAVGTLSDMSSSASLTTTILRSFNLETSQTGEVVDAMAVAVNKSKLEISDLSTIFNYVGVAAKMAGASFKDALGASMALSNAGIKASTVGTGLRMVFITLAEHSLKLQKAVYTAGMSMSDFDIKSQGFTKVLENMGTLLSKNANFYDIFGVRAGNAAIQVAESAKEIHGFIEAMNEVGAIDSMIEARMSGLMAQFQMLANKFKVLFDTIASDGASGPLLLLLKTVNAVMDGFIALADSGLGKFVIAVGTTVIAVGSLITVLKLLRTVLSLDILVTSVRYLINFAASFAGVSAAATAVTGEVAAAGAAVTATGAAATAASGAFGTLWAIISAHPIGALITALGLGAIAFFSLRKSTEDVISENKRAAESINQEIEVLKQLREGFLHLDEGSMAWTSQVQKLLELHPELADSIDLNIAKTKDYIAVIDELLKRRPEDWLEKQKSVLLDSAKQYATGQDIRKRALDKSAGLNDADDTSYELGLWKPIDNSLQLKKEGEQTMAAAEKTAVDAIVRINKSIKDEAAKGVGANQDLIDSFNKVKETALEAFPENVRQEIVKMADAQAKVSAISKENVDIQTKYNESLKSLGNDSLSAEYEKQVNTIKEADKAIEELTKAGADSTNKEKQDWLDRKTAAITYKGTIDSILEDLQKKTQKIELDQGLTSEGKYLEEQKAKQEAYSKYVDFVTKSYAEEIENSKASTAKKMQDFAEYASSVQMDSKKMRVEQTKIAEEGAADILRIALEVKGILISLFGGDLMKGEVRDIQSVNEWLKKITEAIKGVDSATLSRVRAENSLATSHKNIFELEQKQLANLNSLMSLESARMRLAVARGQVSAESAEEVSSRRRIELAKQELALAQQMQAKAQRPEDKETASKALNQAQTKLYAAEAEGLERAKKARQEATDNRIALDKAASDLELAHLSTVDTYYMVIAKKQHAAKMTYISEEIAALRQRAAEEANGSNAQKKIYADIVQKQAELVREQTSYEKQQIEERMRYMDEYRKYGIMSMQEYMRYLKIAYNEGQISALEFERKRILYEGTFLEQVKLGVNDWLAEQKTLGEATVELVKGTLDDLKSGIGDAISNLIDGSKTLQESLSDTLKSIGKRFVNFAVDQLFNKAVSGLNSLFGGSLDISSLTGDAGATEVTTLNTAATQENTLALQELTAQMGSGGGLSGLLGKEETATSLDGDTSGIYEGLTSGSSSIKDTDYATIADKVSSNLTSETETLANSVSSVNGSITSLGSTIEGISPAMSTLTSSVSAASPSVATLSTVVDKTSVSVSDFSTNMTKAFSLTSDQVHALNLTNFSGSSVGNRLSDADLSKWLNTTPAGQSFTKSYLDMAADNRYDILNKLGITSADQGGHALNSLHYATATGGQLAGDFNVRALDPSQLATFKQYMSTNGMFSNVPGDPVHFALDKNQWANWRGDSNWQSRIWGNNFSQDSLASSLGTRDLFNYNEVAAPNFSTNSFLNTGGFSSFGSNSMSWADKLGWGGGGFSSGFGGFSSGFGGFGSGFDFSAFTQSADQLSSAASVLTDSGSTITSSIGDWAGTTSSIFDSWSSSTSGTLDTAVSGLSSLFGSSGSSFDLGGLGSSFFSMFAAKGAAFSDIGTRAFAKGSAFLQGLPAFAKGSVFSAPRVFAFAQGGASALGMLAEKGPEGVLPLKRDDKGDLGVSVAEGGGASPINVINVADPQSMYDAMASAMGQRVVMNIIGSNRKTFQRLLSGPSTASTIR